MELEIEQVSPPDAAGTTAVCSDPASQVSSKYPIYDGNVAGRVHSIQTAAQFGDKDYIISKLGINVLEKALDADVNAMVSSCGLLVKPWPRSRLLHGGMSVQDNVGRTALHWATENMQKAAVRTLLDFAADPRIPEAASLRTPIFLAVKNNDVEMLNMLVERLTADEVKELCNAPDRSGCTPLHWCRERYATFLCWLAPLFQMWRLESHSSTLDSSCTSLPYMLGNVHHGRMQAGRS